MRGERNGLGSPTLTSGQYSHGNIMNHEPVRKRKLLLIARRS